MRKTLLALVLARSLGFGSAAGAAGEAAWPGPLGELFAAPEAFAPGALARNGIDLKPTIPRFSELDWNSSFGQRAARPLTAFLEKRTSPEGFAAMTRKEQAELVLEAMAAAAAETRAELQRLAEPVEKETVSAENIPLAAERLRELAHYGIYFLEPEDQHRAARANGLAQARLALLRKGEALAQARAWAGGGLDWRWPSAIAAGLPAAEQDHIAEVSQNLARLDLARARTRTLMAPLAEFLESKRRLTVESFEAAAVMDKRLPLQKAIREHGDEKNKKAKALLAGRDKAMSPEFLEETSALLIDHYPYLKGDLRGELSQILPVLRKRLEHPAERETPEETPAEAGKTGNKGRMREGPPGYWVRDTARRPRERALSSQARRRESLRQWASENLLLFTAAALLFSSAVVLIAVPVPASLFIALPSIFIASRAVRRSLSQNWPR